MNRCGSIGCERAKETRVHWPGKTTELCTRCAARAMRVAQHMGFTLTVDMLHPAPLPPKGT